VVPATATGAPGHPKGPALIHGSLSLSTGGLRVDVQSGLALFLSSTSGRIDEGDEVAHGDGRLHWHPQPVL